MAATKDGVQVDGRDRARSDDPMSSAAAGEHPAASRAWTAQSPCGSAQSSGAPLPGDAACAAGDAGRGASDGGEQPKPGAPPEAAEQAAETSATAPSSAGELARRTPPACLSLLQRSLMHADILNTRSLDNTAEFRLTFVDRFSGAPVPAPAATWMWGTQDAVTRELSNDVVNAPAFLSGAIRKQMTLEKHPLLLR